MREFFQQNSTIILFAHGLVFFSLGFAIWLQRRRASRLVLPNALIWLAAYACVEAFAVWGRAFIPIQRTYLDSGIIDVLQVVRAGLQIVAFLLLLRFGLRLLVRQRRRRTVLVGVVGLVGVGILLGNASLAGALDWNIDEWENSVDAAGRLLILLPAIALSAAGVWRQRAELAAAGMTGINPFAAAAAAVLIVYGFVAGLILDPAPWVPSAFQDTSFFTATAVPISALRGLVGLALLVVAVKLLEIFEVEAKQRLDALERSRAVAEERSRFRRDLHDGTIQSIYAAALHLEAISLRLGDQQIRGEVREVVTELNTVTDDIRRYIVDLSRTPDTPSCIADLLNALAGEMQIETGIPIRFTAGGINAAGPIPDGASRHLEQILREALSNALRHASSGSIDVSLAFAADELELVVRDDGSGLDGRDPAGGGQGLRNMGERARRLGGRLTIDGGAHGTRLVVSVPLDSDVPEPTPDSQPIPEVVSP